MVEYYYTVKKGNIMTEDRALIVLDNMAKERNKSILEVLSEWRKYEKNGDCQHFWPDQNIACRIALGLETE